MINCHSIDIPSFKPSFACSWMRNCHTIINCENFSAICLCHKVKTCANIAIFANINWVIANLVFENQILTSSKFAMSTRHTIFINWTFASFVYSYTDPATLTWKALWIKFTLWARYKSMSNILSFDTPASYLITWRIVKVKSKKLKQVSCLDVINITNMIFLFART